MAQTRQPTLEELRRRAYIQTLCADLPIKWDLERTNKPDVNEWSFLSEAMDKSLADYSTLQLQERIGVGDETIYSFASSKGGFRITVLLGLLVNLNIPAEDKQTLPLAEIKNSKLNPKVPEFLPKEPQSNEVSEQPRKPSAEERRRRSYIQNLSRNMPFKWDETRSNQSDVDTGVFVSDVIDATQEDISSIGDFIQQLQEKTGMGDETIYPIKSTHGGYRITVWLYNLNIPTEDKPSRTQSFAENSYAFLIECDVPEELKGWVRENQQHGYIMDEKALIRETPHLTVLNLAQNEVFNEICADPTIFEKFESDLNDMIYKIEMENHLIPQRIEIFGNDTSFMVITLKQKGDVLEKQLYPQLKALLEKYGVTFTEKYPFKPHLTLGIVTDPRVNIDELQVTFPFNHSTITLRNLKLSVREYIGRYAPTFEKLTMELNFSKKLALKDDKIVKPTTTSVPGSAHTSLSIFSSSLADESQKKTKTEPFKLKANAKEFKPATPFG